MCPQCHGTGREYPYGHEGEREWEQRCGGCDGTGEVD